MGDDDKPKHALRIGELAMSPMLERFTTVEPRRDGPMTQGDCSAMARRFSFRAPMPMTFYVSEHPRHGWIYVVCEMTTWARGTPLPYRVVTHKELHLERLTPAMFANFLREQALWLWKHEFDEWFSFDGRLTHDPHGRPLDNGVYSRVPVPAVGDLLIVDEARYTTPGGDEMKDLLKYEVWRLLGMDWSKDL